MPNDPVPADWPERFVYMCNATQGAPVNIVPMVNAGAGRIVGMVILIGLSNPDKPTNGDRSNALLPAERLRDYGRSILGLNDKDMIVLKGRTEYFSDWTNAFGTAADLAEELNAAIVYNITGGSKPQAVGALLGQPAARDGSPAVSVISFGHDRRTRRLQIDPKGQLNEDLLPVAEGMTLDTYLKSLGLKENAGEARRTKQSTMQHDNNAADAMEKLLAKTGQFNLRRMFAGLYSPLYNKVVNGEISVVLKPESAGFFKPVILNLPNTTLDDVGTVIIRSSDDLEFLQGKWLEHAIYTRVARLFTGRNDAEVASGVRFGSGAGGNVDYSDFDLAVLSGDRLDLIEAKAYINAKGMHEAIEKLARYREIVGGHAGSAWIVAPLLDHGQLNKVEMLTHAKDAGISLLFGKSALNTLESQIKASHRLP